jgi:hypothetical protein
MYKGLLAPGKVKVTLQCPLGNSGPTAITVTWMANPGGKVPEPKSFFVGPGQGQVLYEGDVLSSAAVRVDFAVPPGGLGDLTVEQPGTTRKWNGTVSGSQNWVFNVDVP